MITDQIQTKNLQEIRETIYELLNPPVDMNETIKMVQDLQITGKNNTVLMMQSAVILNHINTHATRTLKIIDRISQKNDEFIVPKEVNYNELIEDLGNEIINKRIPIMSAINSLKRIVTEIATEGTKSRAEAARLIGIDDTTLNNWINKFQED